jgi:hypothetical protein
MRSLLFFGRGYYVDKNYLNYSVFRIGDRKQAFIYNRTIFTEKNDYEDQIFCYREENGHRQYAKTLRFDKSLEKI